MRLEPVEQLAAARQDRAELIVREILERVLLLIGPRERQFLVVDDHAASRICLPCLPRLPPDRAPAQKL